MALRRRSRAVSTGVPSAVDPARVVVPQVSVLESALDRAVTVPSATIHAHVEQLRRRNPYASPAQVIALLEREYLRVVTAAGAAVGAAAAAPVVGTGIAFALTASDVAAFFAASSAFSLAVASVHGIEVQDAARRRALVLATILGESGAKVVGDAAEISSVHFARTLLTRMPTTTIRRVNSRLMKRLVRRQAAKQGGLALGRLAPFGVGAAIGIMGARGLGRSVVTGARIAFGPPPERFPQVIEVIETGGAPLLAPGPEHR